MNSMKTVAARLGAFAAGLKYEDLPAEVVDKAKACLAHGLTVGAAGRVTGLGDIAEEAIGGGNGPARLLTSGATAPAAQAAFVNAVLFHSRAQEDTHGTAHLGSIIIPASLAVAEEVEADGQTLLCGIVAGYEIGAALASRYTALSSARGFRASPVYGVFAATAAAGRILGLPADQISAALAFAAAFAGGTLESFAAGTREWHFQNGIASQNGVTAARVGAAGAQGAPSAIESPVGFLAAVCGTTDGADEIPAQLGETWEILNVTFKLYPVCAFNQTPVTIAARLAEAHALAPADIERVRVEMNEYEAGYPGIKFQGPFSTPVQTLMSAPFSVAAALKQRNVAYDDLLRYEDSEILGLVDRITIEADGTRPQMTSRLTIETTSGAVHEDAIDDRPEEYLAWGFSNSREAAQRVLPETGMAADDLDRLLAAIDDLDSTGSATAVIDLVVEAQERASNAAA
jgi:2-methylcitrate dehydratase PrpD